MNKLLLLFIVIAFITADIKAQDGYLRFKDTFNFEKGACVKGDILPFVRSKTKDKVHVLFGVDTIKDVIVSLINVDTLTSAPKNLTEFKGELVQKKGEDSLYIDLSTLTDPVLVVSQGNGANSLPIDGKSCISKASVGRAFRIVSKDAQSLFFYSTELDAIPSLITGLENDDVAGDSDSFNGIFASLKWWYLLIIIGCIVGGFLGWRGIRNSLISKEPIHEVYKGGSLDEFARANGLKLSKLIKLNSDRLTKEYIELDEGARNKIQRDLKNTKLVTGYQRRNEVTVSSQAELKNDSIQSIMTDGTDRIYTEMENTHVEKNINQRLLVIENLIREIKNSGANSKDILKLREDLTRIQTEKSSLELVVKQLKDDNAHLVRRIETTQNDNARNKADFDAIKQKALNVDFLRNYCEGVASYFNLCAEVVKNAYVILQRINEQKPQQTLFISHLLINFQTRANTLPVGNWIQIVNDIRETGVTANKQIIRSFSQIQDESEKHREFQRLLFNEVLLKYHSSVLILAEGFKNLERFQISSPLAAEAQSIFSNLVLELLNKIKSTGIETKYIPLFANYMDYLGQSKAVDEKLSIAYSCVQGVAKDSIAEVISYGYKNIFGDSDTLIILA